MSQFEQLSFSSSPENPGLSEEVDAVEPEQTLNSLSEDGDSGEGDEILDPETNERLILEAGFAEGLITGRRALGFLEEIGEDTTGMGITQAENRVHQIVQAGLMPYIPRAQLLRPSTQRHLRSAGLGDGTTMTVLERATALKTLRVNSDNSPETPRPSTPPMPPRPLPQEDREAS